MKRLKFEPSKFLIDGKEIKLNGGVKIEYEPDMKNSNLDKLTKPQLNKIKGEIIIKLAKDVHFEPTFEILEMEEKDGVRIIKKVELVEISLVFDNGKNKLAAKWR